MRTAGRLVVLLVAGAALAGCGGDDPQRITRADVAPLIALAQRIGHEDACAQARDIPRLNARAAALVDAHEVPPALTAAFTAGVQALVDQTPPCVPPVPQQPAAPPQVAVTTPTPHADQEKHGHGHGDGHDHGKGHE